MAFNLLVTGGAGFIGSNFIRMILENQSSKIGKLTVLDKLTYAGNLRNLEGLNKSSFEFIKGDICDRELVFDLAKQNDLIINFAAESHVDRSIHDAREFVNTNILGAQILFEATRESASGKIVHISTDEVYGSINENSWDELEPLQPNSPYSASKASADLLARSYFKTYGIDVRITRCSNNYGPYQNPEKVIPRFITSAIQGKPLELYGNGSNVRDWLHVSDHCSAIWKVATGGAPGAVYNVGGGLELDNLTLAKTILRKINRDESAITFIADRLGHDFRYSVDFNKIKLELKYEPEIDFETGIESTIDWYMKNTDWWRPLVTR